MLKKFGFYRCKFHIFLEDNRKSMNGGKVWSSEMGKLWTRNDGKRWWKTYEPRI